MNLKNNNGGSSEKDQDNMPLEGAWGNGNIDPELGDTPTNTQLIAAGYVCRTTALERIVNEPAYCFERPEFLAAIRRIREEIQKAAHVFRVSGSDNIYIK